MARWAQIFLVPAILACSLFLWTCGTYEDKDVTSPNGYGYVEDLGVPCQTDCDLLWCFMKDYPKCVSTYCVGTPGSEYCSQLCLNNNDCPDGFSCTDQCDIEGPLDGYCVFDEHYEMLTGLDICPAL